MFSIKEAPKMATTVGMLAPMSCCRCASSSSSVGLSRARSRSLIFILPRLREAMSTPKEEEQQRDELLKRLLKTPPQPRPKREREQKKREAGKPTTRSPQEKKQLAIKVPRTEEHTSELQSPIPTS